MSQSILEAISGVEPYYIAVDPGKTNIGFALFTEDGSVIFFSIISGQDEFLDWLEKQSFKVLIYENFRNRGHLFQQYSANETSQLIGAIKRIAHKKKAKLIEQEPSPGLTIGLRFLGLYEKYKGKHAPDDISALAHGTYYLKKNGVIK